VSFCPDPALEREEDAFCCVIAAPSF